MGRMCVITLLVMVARTLALSQPYIVGRIVDGLYKHVQVYSLYVLVLVLFCITVARYIIAWLKEYTDLKFIAFEVSNHIASFSLQKILTLSLGQISSENSGFKLDTIQQGETALKNMMAILLNRLMPMIVNILVTITALFMIEWHIALDVLTFMSCFMIASYLINKRMVPELIVNRKKTSKVVTKYWEIIKHLKLIMLRDCGDAAVRKHKQEYQEVSYATQQIWLQYFRRIFTFREPFLVAGQMSVFLLAIYYADQGRLSIGTLVFAIGWSYKAFDSMDEIGGMQREIVGHMQSFNRFYELLSTEPDVVPAMTPKILDFSEAICFTGVSFTYPRYTRIDDRSGGESGATILHESPALHDIDLTIRAGEVVAFVGASGAGKSTLIHLLLGGAYPTSGQITIDGHDLHSLDLGHWRQQLGCALQETNIVDGTVRENLLFGLTEAHAKVVDLDTLAKQVRIDEFFPRLGATGFDTQIGDGGTQLSGGQRQRIVLGRILASNPRLLILDEATNALDPENEALVREAMDNALRDRTGIIIAHRLSTVRTANQIVVMDKGRIVGQGTHMELMGTCQVYQALVHREMQALQS